MVNKWPLKGMVPIQGGAVVIWSSFVVIVLRSRHRSNPSQHLMTTAASFHYCIPHWMTSNSLSSTVGRPITTIDSLTMRFNMVRSHIMAFHYLQMLHMTSWECLGAHAFRTVPSFRTVRCPSPSNRRTSVLSMSMSSNTQQERKKIAVIGGGASGMFAATAAADYLQRYYADKRGDGIHGCDVIVFEGTSRTMSKVRISGGGRVSAYSYIGDMFDTSVLLFQISHSLIWLISQQCNGEKSKNEWFLLDLPFLAQNKKCTNNIIQLCTTEQNRYLKFSRPILEAAKSCGAYIQEDSHQMMHTTGLHHEESS